MTRPSKLATGRRAASALPDAADPAAREAAWQARMTSLKARLGARGIAGIGTADWEARLARARAFRERAGRG